MVNGENAEKDVSRPGRTLHGRDSGDVGERASRIVGVPETARGRFQPAGCPWTLVIAPVFDARCIVGNLNSGRGEL